MGETQLVLVAFLDDLKDDVSAVPLGLILDEIDAGVGRAPDDPFAGDPFRNLVPAAVKFFEAVGELRAETVGGSFNISFPPFANIVDRLEEFVRRLVRFAGPDWEVSVVPPTARAVLSRFDDKAANYEERIPPVPLPC
jgi:hypothetical protein